MIKNDASGSRLHTVYLFTLRTYTKVT